MVSAAELKIRRIPEHVWKVAYRFQSFESAVNASRSLLELDVKPAVCRAYNEVESLFQFEDQTCFLLLIYHFRSEPVQEAVRGQVSALLARDSVPADPALVDRWLEKRFNFREDIEGVKRMGYVPETLEVASKWSRLLELYSDAMETLGGIQGVAGVGAHVSHLYDQGACIYFTVLFEPRAETYRALWEAMARVAKTHDATISHHHGVGILKKVYAMDEIPTELMKRIKDAVDPKGVLSPDRLP